MFFEYLKTYKAQIFNRDQSAKVFKETHEKNAAICMIKNSEFYIVIFPHELYFELLEKREARTAIQRRASDDKRCFH